MSKEIYYNGPIITMDENYMFPEAILVENHKIKNIGSKDFIFGLKDSNTEVINLENKTLMPSFIDSHSHLTAFASTLNLKDSLEPNGYLEENTFMSCSKNIPKPNLESNVTFLKKAQDIYLSYGITTCQGGLVNEDEFNTLKYASDTKSLKLDVIGYVDLQKSKFLMDNNKNYKKNYVNRFKLGGYKIFLDGSPQGKTAWLTKPYENSGDYLGYPIYKDFDVLKHVETAFKEDLQLTL